MNGNRRHAAEGDDKTTFHSKRKTRKNRNRVGETSSLSTGIEDNPQKYRRTQESASTHAPTKEEEAEERRDTNRIPSNHFTRSQNLTPSMTNKTKRGKQLKLSISSEKLSDGKPNNISINACATILAELDTKSYHQYLLQDACNVMERILQPMSLPWTHKVTPVARNIPCDIDEMIDVVTIDDGSHTPYDSGNFGYGQFETGRLRSGDSAIRLANSSGNYRAASRRSRDSGIIELSTIVLPYTLASYNSEDCSMIQASLPVDSNEYCDNNGLTGGETILQCFEVMQGLKKRRVEQARSCVTSFEISVKLNSSSSRSSIVTKSLGKRKSIKFSTPIILEAILPLEVENGRRMSKARAKIALENLGSYNIRHGLLPLKSGNYSNRPPVGRTRRMWTNKKLLDQPQRFSYASLLTGQKIENGAEKRPRNIRVHIKVDGDIYHGEQTEGHSRLNARMYLQASLQCDQLIRNLIDERREKSDFSYFIPPSIECIPDCTGSIRVVCTSPGSILQPSISPILKLARKKSSLCCTVCWRSTEGGLEVKECARCGLLAHIECCLDPGETRVLSESYGQTTREEWTCAVCCYHKWNYSKLCEAEKKSQEIVAIKKSKRKSRPSSRLKDHFDSMKTQKVDHTTFTQNKEIKCSICLLSGGAMSRISVEGGEFWVHETCRIWTNNQRHSSSRNLSCVLCGISSAVPKGLNPGKDKQMQNASPEGFSSPCVVKCAAAGCHIHVHPMCALVSSLASQFLGRSGHKQSTTNASSNNISNATRNDIELCSKYTLTFSSICGLAHSYGKDPGMRCAANLPIVFCGIHNPAREPSFQGLYPGGRMLKEVQILSVPSFALK